MVSKLGRGLGSLIVETAAVSDKAKENVELLQLKELIPNTYQPRKDFDGVKMEELMNSIKEKGVIQPILARRTEKGYEIIAGERRWRAAKQLGLTEIPVIVKRDVSDVSSLEIALIENIQREELNPINEAEAYKKLINNFGYSLEQVGQVVGKNKTTVSNSVRLLALDKEIRDKLVSGELSTGHAKVLLSVTNEYRQKKLAEIVLKHQLSVRQLELLVEKTPGKRTKKGAAKDPEVARIEEDLQHYLGTKVSLITGRKRGGRLEIHFFSPEDLDRLLKLVMK